MNELPFNNLYMCDEFIYSIVLVAEFVLEGNHAVSY